MHQGHYDDSKPYNRGFVEHDDHHNPGEHIHDDTLDDATVKLIEHFAAQRALNDLRNAFVDTLAYNYTDSPDNALRRAAAALVDAIRHPPGNRDG